MSLLDGERKHTREITMKKIKKPSKSSKNLVVRGETVRFLGSSVAAAAGGAPFICTIITCEKSRQLQ
jgi:hypothetical protein